jgi:hypothetical protein
MKGVVRNLGFGVLLGVVSLSSGAVAATAPESEAVLAAAAPAETKAAPEETKVAAAVETNAAAAATAAKDDPEDLKGSLEAIKQRNRDLERRLSDLETKMGQSPEMQEARQAEIRGLIDQALLENKDKMGPSWLNGLKFQGDLRLRYETDRRTSSSDPNDSRARFRLRFGFEKAWPQEDLTVGFRLASGSNEDPTTTNQTMDSMFSKKPIWIDQAWAKWSPKVVKGLTVTAGKMQNPFVSSDLIWDPDINPEGLWTEYRYPGFGAFEPFVGAGIFELGAFGSTANGVVPPEDPVLDAYDVGFRWNIMKDLKWTNATTFYNWSNIDTEYNRYAFFNANPRGNTITGGTFSTKSIEQVNLTNVVDFKVYNVPVSVYGDWVRNMDASRLPDTQIKDRLGHFIAGPDTRKEAWALGFRIGENKKKGDFSFRYKYGYIESDAVVGYFAESDFGYGNRKGNVYGVQYNITDYLTAGFDLFYTGPIWVAPAAIRRNNPNYEHQFTGLFDLVWRF